MDPNIRKHKRLTERSYSPLAVPKVLRNDITLSYPDGNGHLGFDKTYAAIRKKYCRPRMYTDISSHVGNCTTCHESKRNYANNKTPLCPITLAPHQFIWTF
jgi:hypothetical protein